MNIHRVLVVEDDRLIARDIALQLSELGYQPLGPASSGEQAIEMTAQLLPDLVLMDVHLGSAMTGITAAQAIHNQFGVPSIYLSAFADQASLERAKQTQPVGYLSKPFTETELRKVIETAQQLPIAPR